MSLAGFAQTSRLEPFGNALKSRSGETDEERRLLADCAARFLAIHLLRHYCAFPIREKLTKPALGAGKLLQVRDYIEAHVSSALNLDDLASVAHISPFHFARLFKTATGETPHDFVTRIRMERAKALLKSTDWTASKIASAVGFSSKSHFTAAFQSFSGVTPIRFRNIYR
jgi:AraC family transcriptional regulator